MAETTIEQIKEKIVPVLKEHDISRSALFGSVVRGEDTPDSDVDILVELPDGKSLLDLVRLGFDLEEVLKKKVDVLTYDAISPYLRDRILSEQILIL